MPKQTLDITYFLSFCIEQYKKAKALSDANVMGIFNKYGVLDYLYEHFEILHTQNHLWLTEDIDEFISNRKTTQA